MKVPSGEFSSQEYFAAVGVGPEFAMPHGSIEGEVGFPEHLAALSAVHS